jgi:heme-degrading monooxygenase HmoA
MTVFSVIFEVHPNKANWNDYLDNAKMLRSELEKIDGFVDNIRYKSFTRDGWILSLSNWRDEKSLVRWRTQMRHHDVQQKGRDEILADYHLRVGQIIADDHLPAGYALAEQRPDETEVGQGTTITLINPARPAGFRETNDPDGLAKQLGLNPWAATSTSWGHIRRGADARRLGPSHVLEGRFRRPNLRGRPRAEERRESPAGSDRPRLWQIRPPRGPTILPRRQRREDSSRVT